ncbi:MAG: hypothetical protein E6J34_23615 [Chloroflexi bacterium]|nr:MAG: hypothetical protein E6J34_23615 [Chloroflexota bacterium]
MYLHTFNFQTTEQAQEASGLQITCTNMTVGDRYGTPTISFQTNYILGPVTLIVLKQETQAIKLAANEPLAGAPSPHYSVSLGQTLLTIVAGAFFLGLAWLEAAGMARVIAAWGATGWITICSNDLLPILRALARTGKPMAAQDEEVVR